VGRRRENRTLNTCSRKGEGREEKKREEEGCWAGWKKEEEGRRREGGGRTHDKLLVTL
jgi:hypothetical protein